MSLYLDVGLDDVLLVGDTYVTLERKSGTRARLRIIGHAKVELMRNAKRDHAGPHPNPVNQVDEE